MIADDILVAEEKATVREAVQNHDLRLTALLNRCKPNN